jgi:hypothetical protein
VWKKHLVAVPIDAASVFANYRPELPNAAGLPPPAVWQDVVAPARRKLVVMPGHPVATLLNFLALCVSQDGKVNTRKRSSIINVWCSSVRRTIVFTFYSMWNRQSRSER